MCSILRDLLVQYFWGGGGGVLDISNDSQEQVCVCVCKCCNQNALGAHARWPRQRTRLFSFSSATSFFEVESKFLVD
jgi:hypothetical protein